MISIKEIIKTVATSLGEFSVSEYIDGLSDDENEAVAGEEVLAKVNVLVNLTNLVISELAGTFIPMKKEEIVTPENGKIEYSELTNGVIRIRQVLDLNENPVAYKIHPEYITCKDEPVKVIYDCVPDSYDLTSETGYSGSEVSVAVLSYGVSAEYCLTEGRFDEAVMWRERYSEGIARLCPIKNRRVRGRVWM